MNCKLSETCKSYSNKGYEPYNHYVRVTIPCIKFNGECIEGIDKLQGDACNISKIKRLKGELK